MALVNVLLPIDRVAESSHNKKSFQLHNQLINYQIYLSINRCVFFFNLILSQLKSFTRLIRFPMIALI